MVFVTMMSLATWLWRSGEGWEVFVWSKKGQVLRMDVNSDISNSDTLPETNSSPLKILHPKRNSIFQPSIHQFSGASCWVSGNCKSSPLSSIKSCNLKIDGWKATFLKGAWIFFSAAKMWVSGRAHPYPSLMTFMPRLCLSWERDSCFFIFFCFPFGGWITTQRYRGCKKNGYVCITTYSWYTYYMCRLLYHTNSKDSNTMLTVRETVLEPKLTAVAFSVRKSYRLWDIILVEI